MEKPKRAKPNEYVVFHCPECFTAVANWAVRDLVEKGIPVCPDCDQDMEIIWKEEGGK